MNGEPLITWPDPLFELLSFVAAFLAVGAVGFRLSALRRLLAAPAGVERDFARAAARRAAWLGLAGAAIGAVLLARELPEMAEESHLGVAALITTQPAATLQVVLAGAAIVGFLLAAAGRTAGWTVAAVGVLVAPVQTALFGQFSRVVNPAHELAGGLWIGTLLMVIVAGVVPALRAPLSPDRRGAIAARLVNGFSPLALGSASALAVLGMVTAWRHLKRLDALWSTPYGYALITKLCLVAGVVALGAWNWRRQKPRMGAEAGAIALRRSASAELALAGAVLAVTAILVSLPTPE